MVQPPTTLLNSFIGWISVGGQNSSSNLFLGSEPHVRALAWLGKKGKMTQDLRWFGQWGLCPLNLFLLIIGHPFTIDWGGPYIGYMGNRERGIQTIGPNLNALGLKIQWIGLLSPSIIWHHTIAPQYLLVKCKEGSGDWIWSDARWGLASWA